MSKKVKIAIYSGAIPSTTFVERLIVGIAKHYDVLIFGVQNTPKLYASANIKVHSTSRSLFINLIKTKWHVFVLLFTNPKRLFIVIKEIQKHKSLYSKWHAFTRLIPIMRFLPDIIHVQWAKDVDRFMFLKEKLGVKLILSLRGAHINYSPIASPTLAESYKRNFPKVDAFHAVSKAIAIEAQKYNAEASKIKVIHSPITEQIFNLYKNVEKSKSKTIRICVVGRFHWIKGMRYLFDALRVLQQENKTFECICIGENCLPEEALFQINQLDLFQSITILGNLNQEVLFKTMQSCDVLVLPSLKEGIANVVLEAMAIGLPVIATHCGGMAEVVIPNETGWLVPTRNPKAIANAIMEVKETSEKEIQRITENAYQLVKKEFNGNESIKKFEALYQLVLDK
ncbi:glycosyltransferase family 4 protein [Lacinutrix gracilariae]|uniref:Glycosyltransferase family 4 protein n=1 Tax=Lacinutrix gracilariae TaxID=1747198 RepID=A0ABW5JZ65_9FLAO